MTTDKKILANRENATHSTGPKTPEGKEVSSLNALVHGATSRRLILPDESQEDFEALLGCFIETCAPVDAIELAHIENLATSMWRLRRMQRIEAGFFENRQNAIIEANPAFTGNPGAALAEIFANEAEAKKAALILRYVTAAERAYRNATTELKKAQEARKLREAQTLLEETAATEAAEATPTHEAPTPAKTTPPLTRPERRALERLQRKADKRARRQNGFVSQLPKPSLPLPQPASGTTPQSHPKAA